MKGKGLGAVAVRKIFAGEQIIVETPIVTVEGGNNSDVKRQIAVLPDHVKEAFLELADAQAASKGWEKSLTGILGTNLLRRTPESSDTNLCLNISRFNHSCDPNCEQSWDPEAGKQRVFASTQIQRGEELVLPYLDVCVPSAERSRELLAAYSFRCFCPACSTSNPDGELRRANMKKVRRRLELAVQEQSGFVGDIDANVALDFARELLELYDDEVFHPKGVRLEACSNAFELALRANKVEEAGAWARKAYNHALTCLGKDHQQTRRLKQYASEPESYQDKSQEGGGLGDIALVGTLLVVGVGTFTMLLRIFQPPDTGLF